MATPGSASALALNRSLLSAVNADGETPLVAVVTSGRTSIASFLKCCHDVKVSEAILVQDNRGFNALHHAIRSGHSELALELIQAYVNSISLLLRPKAVTGSFSRPGRGRPTNRWLVGPRRTLL
jgi:ankyrin repeat protein